MDNGNTRYLSELEGGLILIVFLCLPNSMDKTNIDCCCIIIVSMFKLVFEEYVRKRAFLQRTTRAEAYSGEYPVDGYDLYYKCVKNWILIRDRDGNVRMGQNVEEIKLQAHKFEFVH